MIRRAGTIALGLCLIVVTVACGRETSEEGRLLRFIAATERLPREYVYEEETEDQKVIVRGKFEDDLRYSSALSIDANEVFEFVVSDDAAAIRVIDTSKIPGFEQVALADKELFDALNSGRWLLDPQGAPPLLATITRAGSQEVGNNFALDASYVFQYLRRSIGEGQGVVLFNPDNPNYNPIDDPFERPVSEAGIRRYDVIPPELPRRSQRGTEAALPTTPHFRKMSFYVKDGLVIKAVEEIDVEGHSDFRRAREGRGPKYPLVLLEAIRAGKGREPIRLRSLSLEITPFETSGVGPRVGVTLPVDALLMPLGLLFGQPGGGAEGGSAEAPPPEGSTPEPEQTPSP